MWINKQVYYLQFIIPLILGLLDEIHPQASLLLRLRSFIFIGFRTRLIGFIYIVKMQTFKLHSPT